MTTRTIKLLSIAVAALAAAGCGGGGGGGYNSQASAPPPVAPAPPPPAPTGESFTNWSKSGVFAKPADGQPEVMDELVFNFDGNDNPEAYSELLPTT